MAAKILIVLLVLCGVGFVLFQIEDHTASLRSAAFHARIAQAENGMTEDEAIARLGAPDVRANVRAGGWEYAACEKAGGSRVLEYRFEAGGVFRHVMGCTVIDTVSLCVDDAARVVDREWSWIYVCGV